MCRSVKVVVVAVALALLTTPLAQATSRHSEFIGYPAFRKPGGAVEAVHNKGLVAELIVNCGRGRAGILTVSKTEGLICGPDHRCVSKLEDAIARLCR